jgi:hypothetical protein
MPNNISFISDFILLFVRLRTELHNMSDMLRYVLYRTRTELNRSLLELI